MIEYRNPHTVMLFDPYYYTFLLLYVTKLNTITIWHISNSLEVDEVPITKIVSARTILQASVL